MCQTLNKALYDFVLPVSAKACCCVERRDDKINAAPSFSHFSLGRNDIHGQFTLMVHFILKGRAITGQPCIILINIYPGRYAARGLTRSTRAEDYLSQYTNARCSFRTSLFSSPRMARCNWWAALSLKSNWTWRATQMSAEDENERFKRATGEIMESECVVKGAIKTDIRTSFILSRHRKALKPQSEELYKWIRSGWCVDSI